MRGRLGSAYPWAAPAALSAEADPALLSRLRLGLCPDAPLQQRLLDDPAEPSGHLIQQHLRPVRLQRPNRAAQRRPAPPLDIDLFREACGRTPPAAGSALVRASLRPGCSRNRQRGPALNRRLVRRPQPPPRSSLSVEADGQLRGCLMPPWAQATSVGADGPPLALVPRLPSPAGGSEAERHAVAFGVPQVRQRLNVVCLDSIRRAADVQRSPHWRTTRRLNVAAFPPEPLPGERPDLLG